MNKTAEKKDLFYIIVLILTLVAVIVGATFAAYYFLHKQEEGSSAVYTGTFSIEYLSGDIINFHYLTPSTDPDYEDTENIYKNNFKVTNIGSLDGIITINVDVNKNEFSKDIIMYKIFTSEGEGIQEGTITGEGKTELATNIVLPSNETANYTLIIWLKETGVNQNEEMKKQLTGKIEIDANQKID